jgi:hypothetical protein
LHVPIAETEIDVQACIQGFLAADSDDFFRPPRRQTRGSLKKPRYMRDGFYRHRQRVIARRVTAVAGPRLICLTHRAALEPGGSNRISIISRHPPKAGTLHFWVTRTLPSLAGCSKT